MTEETSSPAAESQELALLREGFADWLVEAAETDGELRLEVTPHGLPGICAYLKDELDFEYPADMTAYDTGERFVVWIRVCSLARNRTAILRVALDRDNPRLHSLTATWPGMSYHEREIFDLYGIRFPGHPDQHDDQRMRILLPEDWEGHPFRKDYEPVFSGNPLHGPQETN